MSDMERLENKIDKKLEVQDNLMQSILEKWQEYCKEPFERLNQLWYAVIGTDGDGIADNLKIFAKNFHEFILTRLDTCPVIKQQKIIAQEKRLIWNGADRRKKDYRWLLTTAISLAVLIPIYIKLFL